MMKTHTKKQRELRNTLIGWLLVMPSLIFMAAFTVWPVFRSIWLSLTKYKLGMSAPEFIGLKNYINLAGSSLFWKVMGNTLFFALITIVPSMVVGLFLATLVNRKSRLIGFVRTSYFYPVVMPMIAIASIWMFIYMAKNGLLDQMLISMGFSAVSIGNRVGHESVDITYRYAHMFPTEQTQMAKLLDEEFKEGAEE